MSTLTLIFIVLKLVGVISWSWFFVLLPTLLDLLLILITIIISYIFTK